MPKHHTRCRRSVDTTVPATHIDSAQHTGRHVESVGEKTNNFKVVCKSNNGRRDALHELEQKATDEDHMVIVNINSIRSNSKLLVIVAKLKTSSQNIKQYHTKLTHVVMGLLCQSIFSEHSFPKQH